MSPLAAMLPHVSETAGMLTLPATHMSALRLEAAKPLSDKMILPTSSSSISLHTTRSLPTRRSLFL